MYPEEDYNATSVDLLAGAADFDKNGLISFDEFNAFEAVLCSPDAIYLIAFEIFDRDGSKTVTFDEFQAIIKHTKPLYDVAIDINSDLINLYFGKDKKRPIVYLEFCQLLHDFHEELGIQAFKQYDKSQTGFISGGDFMKIMTTVKAHLVTKTVRNNLVALTGRGHVSFPYFMAFNSLLAQIEVFKHIYLTVTKANLEAEVAKEQFLHEAQSYAQVTPSEVDILYRLASLSHPGLFFCWNVSFF